MAKSRGARGAVKPTSGEQHDIIVGALVIIGIVIAVNFIARARSGGASHAAVSSVPDAGAPLQAALDQLSMVPSDLVNAARTPPLTTEQLSATSDDGRYELQNFSYAIGNNLPLSSN